MTPLFVVATVCAVLLGITCVTRLLISDRHQHICFLGVIGSLVWLFVAVMA